MECIIINPLETSLCASEPILLHANANLTSESPKREFYKVLNPNSDRIFSCVLLFRHEIHFGPVLNLFKRTLDMHIVYGYKCQGRI